MNENCKTQVWNSGGWGTYQCGRKAVRDGYCTTHHPEAVKARRAKSDARYDARRQSERRQRNDRARQTVWAFLDHVALSLPPALQAELLAAMEKWECEPDVGGA